MTFQQGYVKSPRWTGKLGIGLENFSLHLSPYAAEAVASPLVVTIAANLMTVLCPLLSDIGQSGWVARTHLDSHDPQLMKQLRFDLTAELDTPGLNNDFRGGAKESGIEGARRTERCPAGFNLNRRRYTPGFVHVEGSRTLKLRSAAALDFACEWSAME